MSEIIMGVEGLDSSDSRLAVTNALYKYSGVLDINVSPGGEEMRVRYDSSNILARDLEETVQNEGYNVKWLRE
ncbi:MAG: heavy-metal-associated domain-containing protein [Actinobacteria bacterium]|nr:heavy-metal-associated domain-containing protein [Actinomycetota bacterium]